MERGRPSARARAWRAMAVLAVSATVMTGPAGGAWAATEGDPEPPAPTVPGAPPVPGVPGSTPAELPPLAPLPVIAPELAGVGLHSPTYDDVDAERDRVEDDLVAATDLEAAKTREIADLNRRERALSTRIDEARRRAEHWEGEQARLRTELRIVAVSTYVSGSGREQSPLMTLDTNLHDRWATAAVTAGALADRQLADYRTATRNARTHRDEQRVATATRRDVRHARDEADRVRLEAADDRERLTRELAVAVERVDEERRLATVDGADFPLVVLDAYWKAARAMDLLAPGCGVPWWALAGIGRIESGHGTHGASEVRADGSLTVPIIGIPLTGAFGTAHISDSDGGLVDGDPVYDRATGPMQFIPQTWDRWGLDGSGDGLAISQNIYDAALAAARYLCASGPLTDDAGLHRAYFSYNHSDLYVLAVLTRAHEYEATVKIPAPG